MSGQNRSSAVMQQRQAARDALDDFPTPPFATRALCEWLIARGYNLKGLTVREPCANRGYMVIPLQEYFKTVLASDVHDYGVGFTVEDYLFGPHQSQVGMTIMNPPFRLAAQFIERARHTTKNGVVAVFCRTAFLEGVTRYETLFSQTPPTAILQFTERVVIHKGLVRRKGDEYVDAKGISRRASSATAYCWLVFELAQPKNDEIMAPEFHWIPPSFDSLERPGDYEGLGND